MKGHLMREDGYVNRSVGMIYISFQHHPTCMSGENARAGFLHWLCKNNQYGDSFIMVHLFILLN